LPSSITLLPNSIIIEQEIQEKYRDRRSWCYPRRATPTDPTHPRRANPYSLLTLIAAFRAGNAIAGWLAAGLISTVALTFSRWFIACVVFYVIAERHLIKDWAIVRRHLSLLVTLGAMVLPAFNIGLYWSLSYTIAIYVTIEQFAVPMLITLANYWFFKTRITVLQGAGQDCALDVRWIQRERSSDYPIRVLNMDITRGQASLCCTNCRCRLPSGLPCGKLSNSTLSVLLPEWTPA